MSCCSQRRQAISAMPQLRVASEASLVRLTSVVPAAEPSVLGAERLRYVGHTPLNVRGPFSARLYEVNVLLRLIDADMRDVASLLRTTLFERVG